MIIRDSRYVNDLSYAVCIGTTIYSFVSILMITITLYVFKNKLDEPKVKETYGTMYFGVYYYKTKGFKIFYWPIFLLRRVGFFAIPILLF